MKPFLLALFPLVLFCIKPSNSQAQTKVNAVQKSSASSLSDPQQLSLKLKLIKAISNDPDFRKIQSTQQSQMKKIMDASKSKTQAEKIQINESTKGLSPVERLQAMGVQDPEKYMETQKKLIIDFMKLTRKYPELNKFDASTRKEILISAGKELSL